jgi:phosphate acetyltransferase
MSAAQSIYIASTEPHCGKSLISLGICEQVLRKTSKLAIFRPVIHKRKDGKRDKDIDLLLSYFNLDQNYESSYAFYMSEVVELLSRNQIDKLITTIIDKYKKLEAEYDFILCEGSDFTDEGTSIEYGLNAIIANNLNSPVLVLGRGDNHSLEESVQEIKIAVDSFQDRNCEVLGVVVNRAMPEHLQTLNKLLTSTMASEVEFTSVIPNEPVLSSPTMQEIAEFLKAEVLTGIEQMDRQARTYSVAAMQLPNYLSYLRDDAVVITPGDRGDIIMGALLANQSQNFPNVAGIILTTGFKPDETILKLVEGLLNPIPLLSVKTNTYETANKISEINSYLSAKNLDKINIAQKLYRKYVDSEALEKAMSKVKLSGMTPKMFEYNLTARAKTVRKRIVLPEGIDERILKGAQFLINEDIVDITLLGEEKVIREIATQKDIQLNWDKIQIIDPRNSEKSKAYAETFHNLRKHKGVNMDMALDIMSDVSYFGTMMVYNGDADGMVSGAMHTTQHTIRPALQFVKTKPGVKVVSSVFFMCLEDRVLVYGDCAINPNPNAEELAAIAVSSAETALNFGINPKVAMLSYSSGSSGKGADVERVRAATEILNTQYKDLIVEGPIQYDAAVDLSVGQKKLPGSEVAGMATVLIFPDLNTGNNTYKAVQRETGAIAIGPVLQGLNKPVNDLSRGCTVKDIINTVIITAIQAQS